MDLEIRRFDALPLLSYAKNDIGASRRVDSPPMKAISSNV